MAQINVVINPEIILPSYRHLLTSDCDVDILWGGRDSGKSHAIAQVSTIDCLHASYFRMALIKKTYESIKDSQYQTILEIIEDWKLGDLFASKLSPLEIRCINKNMFMARGCDNPQKIKSIRNPSHAWYEEADQLSEEDFITASTSLRSNNARVKERLSFNPEAEGDYKQHWIYKNYFAKEINRMYTSFKSVREIKIPGKSEPVKIKYSCTHTTYHDNPYCTPERQAKLEDLKNTNPYYYNVYAKGKWGIREVKSPFLFNFKTEKHVGTTTWNESEITYLSFDFNKNPICCSVFQWYDGTVFGIETIKLPNSNIDELCQVIDAKYPDAIFIVCGDSTGYNNTALVADDYNYYVAIQQLLRLNEPQIQVITNPKITDNQVTMNRVLFHVKVILDEEKCQQLIFDCMFAEMIATGKMRTLNKESREDPTQQLDALDTFRYFINTFVAPDTI